MYPEYGWASLPRFGNFSVIILFTSKFIFSQVVVVHIFNPSTWGAEAEAGGSPSSRPAWPIEWIPGQPGLYREKLSRNKTNLICYFILCLWVFACSYVPDVYLMPVETRRVHRIPWNWKLTAIWILGIKHRSSGGAASVPNHWAISQGHKLFFFFTMS